MGIFVQDSFTGSAGTSLLSHTGEIGGWITDPSGFPNHDPALAKLDGAGAVYASGALATGDQRNTTAISNVVAPQMDFYAEMVINIGVLDPGASSLVVRFFEQFALGKATGYNPEGFKVFFYNDRTSIEPPAYISTWVPTNIAAFANNSLVTLRAEYRYANEEVKLFVNGTLEVTATGFNAPGNAFTSPPTTPGIFAFDIESYNSPSGEGIQVSSLELGTITPPVPFWTDFVGPINEVV
jgi:hypothetical protein